MKLLTIKGHGGILSPLDKEAIEALSKIPNGSEVLIEYKPKRNAKFHRKGFALLNLVLQNTDKYTNINDLLVEFKLKSGHYEEHITTKGILMYIPKSIAFAEMDEAEFESIYSKWIDIALKHFVQMDKEELERQVINFI